MPAPLKTWKGGVPERPKGADCKSAVTDFEGSNPSPTTKESDLILILFWCLIESEVYQDQRTAD